MEEGGQTASKASLIVCYLLREEGAEWTFCMAEESSSLKTAARGAAVHACGDKGQCLLYI